MHTHCKKIKVKAKTAKVYSLQNFIKTVQYKRIAETAMLPFESHSIS